VAASAKPSSWGYPFLVAEHPRNPKNATGPFYVLQGQCITCGAPRAEAPGLVTLDDRTGCYFHKQPETAVEVNDAIRAMLVSCVEAYRYGGTDPGIRRRLAEVGQSHLCDHPVQGHPVTIRSHARFTLARGDLATEVATHLVSAFDRTWKDGRCTKPVAGDAHRAEFEYTPSSKYSPPRRYVVERVPTPPPGTPRSPYRGAASSHVWVLAAEESRYPPIWLHEVLTGNGAVDIRWFSRDEWNNGAGGQELPY
jgi:hypothetical protein